MKKTLVFTGSLLVLVVLFQYISGFMLTLMHTPRMEEAWQMSRSLTSETMIAGRPSWLLILGLAISAIVAYWISSRMGSKKHSH